MLVDEDRTDRTRRFYDAVAPSYAELIPDTRYESAVDLAMIRDFVELLGEGPKAVLDAGCGTGRMIGHLRGLDPTITPTGVDLSPAMLAEAAASHPDVELIEAAMHDLPFEDERFDGILAWYSIIHTAPLDLDRVFAEFDRVLRPGAIALVGFQSGVGERTAQGAYGHDVELHAFLHDAADVGQRLERTGFTVDTRLERGPRSWERLPQAFVLARKG